MAPRPKRVTQYERKERFVAAGILPMQSINAKKHIAPAANKTNGKSNENRPPKRRPEKPTAGRILFQYLRGRPASCLFEAV